MKYREKISRVRAPKGFSFRIRPQYDNQYVYVELLDSHNHLIGRVSLHRSYSDRNQYQTHSWLDQKYHGKGLGVLIYSRAIQWCLEHGYKVRSSGGSSALAQRVWRGKTIRKKFTIRVRNYTPYKDPSYDTWYAYPLKVKDKRKKKSKGRRR